MCTVEEDASFAPKVGVHNSVLGWDEWKGAGASFGPMMGQVLGWDE